MGVRESAGTVRDDDLDLLLVEGQPPTTQGALSGLARSHTPAGFSKMPIDGSAWPSTITVNLGSSQTLGSITVDLPPSSAWSTRTQTLSVLGSTNGTSFSTLVASATYTWNPSTGNTVTIPLPSGTKDQYVQLSYTANNVQNGAQASEILIFG